MFLRGRPVTMHVPDAQRDSYSLDLKGAAPDNKLKLQWVYGYRGRDCRCNLYLLPTGEIVYFNASVVVLYNTEEQQQRHYLGHDDDVKCLNTLHILGMGVFDRAVTCLAFSKSNGGAHLCAIDDANDHILSVWNWQKEKQLAEVKCSNDSVLGAVFHPTDPNLVKHEKPKYVLCVAFAENGDAITGDSSGNIYVWAKGGSRITHAVSGAHEGGVFSLCVLKDGTMVSGGGKDRQVVLWDHSYVKQCEMERRDKWPATPKTESLNTLHILGMGVFDRAVTCLAFSKSNGGAHLCAIDDANDHILSVWNWQKEKQLAEVKCSNDSVLGAVFHPTDPNLVKHEKPKYVLCVAFAENGDAITGDSSGNIYVWAKGGSRITHAVSGAHEGGVFSLCVLKDGTMVSGGGKDRQVVLWDHSYVKQCEMEVAESLGPVRALSEGKPGELLVGTTKNAILRAAFPDTLTPIVQGHTDELWGLDVHPSMEQFVTCAQDKQVHLWDANSHQPLWSKAIDDQGRSAGFHPSGAVVAVGTMTGRWLVLDTDTRDLVSMHTDGNEIISNVKYSPDGNYLAVGSHDNFVYIYAVTENGRKYSRAGKCSGHSSFVTHLDWSQDSRYMVTNSGDYEILFWVWPDGADGTDVNAVCKSHSSSLLASADDFGKVHLFTFPCSQPRAPSHMYGGHSSHVTNIAFLHDDSHLISTGGKDTSILQWVVV
ncbi:hypothetical protein CRUP_011404 [Coryphaenoides rupestris]|nr:hypothetical protein CRUP_011404 [Coryphaenoides rupestris]